MQLLFTPLGHDTWPSFCMIIIPPTTKNSPSRTPFPPSHVESHLQVEWSINKHKCECPLRASIIITSINYNYECPIQLGASRMWVFAMVDMDNIFDMWWHGHNLFIYGILLVKYYINSLLCLFNDIKIFYPTLAINQLYGKLGSSFFSSSSFFSFFSEILFWPLNKKVITYCMYMITLILYLRCIDYAI